MMHETDDARNRRWKREDRFTRILLIAGITIAMVQGALGVIAALTS